MFSVKNLDYQIKGRGILNIQSLAANSGEFIALLGANGAGKSTLLKAISGEIACRCDVRFYDRPKQFWNLNDLARQVAVLPQSNDTNFPFTAREVIELGLIPLAYSKSEAREAVNRAMESASVIQFSNRLFTQLSGGERQRVQLARVLVQLSQAESPPVLLLDEPTSAQDLGQQHELMGMFKELTEKHQWCIVSILHDINLALRFCNRAWVLQHGSLFSDGKPENVLTPSAVETVWGYRGETLNTSDQRVAFV